MEKRDSKGKLVKEIFPSEIISIIGALLAGIVLSLLILPFKSFIILILMVPALLSLRGNISGPFIARTTRDLIIGDFSKRSWAENVLATTTLSIITAFLIGIFTIILNYALFGIFLLPLWIIILIPIITMLLTLALSIPISTGLNMFAFRKGKDPNNLVNPIMTCIDDFFTVLSFYITIMLLGVP